MLEPDIKISRITEQPTYDAALQKTVHMRVEFMVGNHGPFVEKFLKDDYTADARDFKLNTFAREIRT